MSFASEQKAELLLVTDKNACCRRAMLFGILAAKAEICDDALELNVDGEKTVEYISALVREFYSKDPQIETKKAGGRGKKISFSSKSALKYIANLNNDNVLVPKCASCAAAFLRGVFLAAGRVSDPSKQHQLEFGVLPSRVEILLSILEQLGLSFSVTKRAGIPAIYSRKSETIEDFFALVGMNNTVFKLLNSKINSEVRNNANRISNCETNNISKAVDAAGRQIVLIKELERRGLLGSLPEELLITARLRVQYKDMSISQLAMAMSPPISKSGLSHRLKKLTTLAETLIAGDEIL